MSEIINDNSYILVILIMVLAIIIYGGEKTHNNFQIEYNPKNHQYLNSLTIFETQLQKYNSSDFDYMQITNKVDLSECLIPNIIDIFFINIKPHSYFDIGKYTKNKSHELMILYNHNVNLNSNSTEDNFKNIDNLTDNDLMLYINNKKEWNNNIFGTYAYYYDITKKISIFDIYPIYNNSNSTINITLIIVKKSFWHN
jgi:hypothetical protein